MLDLAQITAEKPRILDVVDFYYLNVCSIMSTNKMSLIDTYRVQESDSNFFESFTALSWRQENKRLRAASDVSKVIVN